MSIDSTSPLLHSSRCRTRCTKLPLRGAEEPSLVSTQASRTRSSTSSIPAHKTGFRCLEPCGLFPPAEMKYGASIAAMYFLNSAPRAKPGPHCQVRTPKSSLATAEVECGRLIFRATCTPWSRHDRGRGKKSCASIEAAEGEHHDSPYICRGRLVSCPHAWRCRARMGTALPASS